MIGFDDIHKVIASRSVSLTTDEISTVCRSAIIDLAKRSIIGATLIPICFLMAMFVSNLVSEEPHFCLQMSLVMLTGLILRAISISKILTSPQSRETRWLQLLFCGCIFMALAWGLLASAIIHHYVLGFSLVLILVLTAGIGAGAIANMCIWLLLGYAYLLCIFIPVIVTGYKLGPEELGPVIIGMIFFVTYLLLQLKFWNVHYWNSQLTDYLLEVEAENQKRVNEKLRQSLNDMAKKRQQLLEGAEYLRSLLDNLRDGVVVCSLNGDVLEANRTFAKLLDSDLEEMVHLSLFELIVPRDKEYCGFEGQWELVVHGKAVEFECWLAKGSANTFFPGRIFMKKVTWKQNRVVLVLLEEISSLKERIADDQAAESLTRSEGYLRAILQNIKLPIYCKDLDGVYVSVNKHFERLTGLANDLIVGRNDDEVFYGSDKVNKFFAFRDSEVAKTGEPVELEGTYTIGGKERNILIHKFPLKRDGQTIYATAGICTDITIMKSALQAAQLANEAKSEFLASITHELRTPMHSILSFARLGEKRTSQAEREKLKSYFSMIIKSGDILLELLSGLLDLSSLESHHAPYSFGKHNLVHDVKKTVDEFSAMLDESEISLSLQVGDETAWARYDRTKLFQIMRNLISNAMKFSSPGKEICVRVVSDYYMLQGIMQPVWKVMIIDQGIGLAKNELETVFGKFVQGSTAERGTGGVGLGLAICKRIVEDHRGAIWAEQNEPEGAIFSFVLPVIE